MRIGITVVQAIVVKVIVCKQMLFTAVASIAFQVKYLQSFTFQNT